MLNIRIGLIGLFIFGLGCSHLSQSNLKAKQAPRNSHLVGISLSPNRGGRLIGELDWNGDGQVGAVDVALIEAVEAQQAARLEKKPPAGFSTPTFTETDLVFSLEQGILSPHSSGALSPYEQASETRWLAKLTKIASHLEPNQGGLATTGILRHSFPGYVSTQLQLEQVCDGVNRWDLGSFRNSGLVPVAVFDLDGTVWSGHVIDGFLAAMGEANLGNENNATLIKLLQALPEIDTQSLKTNSFAKNMKLLVNAGQRSTPSGPRTISSKDLFYGAASLLKGVRPQEAINIAKQVLEVGSSRFGPWVERIFKEKSCSMLELVQILKKKGFEVYFVSAGLAPPVRAAASYFGIPQKNAIASHLVTKDGVFTGEVLSNYSLKANVVRQRLPNPPLLVLGNSVRSDFGMLEESIGISLMVNPDQELSLKEEREVDGLFIGISFR